MSPLTRSQITRRREAALIASGGKRLSVMLTPAANSALRKALKTHSSATVLINKLLIETAKGPAKERA